MAQAALRPPARPSTALTQPATVASPAEGWLTLLLHVMIMAITANSVVRIDQPGRSNVLIPLAVGGLMLGCLAARTPALDAVSHVLAFVLGGVASLLLCTLRVDGVSTTWHRHAANALDLLRRLVDEQTRVRSQPMSDNDLMVVIGLTLWLIGYSSAWTLYRRHWLFAALIVPAGLIFFSLRFEDQEPVASVAAFAIAALVMAARHHAFLRQAEWARLRMPAPRSLTHRFTTSGSVLAVIVLLMGWVVPIQAPDSLINNVSDHAQTLWEQAAQQLTRLGNRTGKGPLTNDTFADFSNSFKIGQQFDPSDDEVATLSAAQPYYLALRRYDVYDGIDWLSGVDQTFRMPGEHDDAPATSVTFAPQQFVALSGEVTSDRQREGGEITVLQNTGGLLFTIETYSMASVPTIAVIGWEQIPEMPIDLQTEDASTLPMSLQELVRDLQSAQFSPDASGRPAVVDADQSRAIELIRSDLSRYPVTTTLSYGDQKHVILTVSGRVPNYDDIEAIYANPPSRMASNYSYHVVGSESFATAEELRGAGTDYPDWVTARYLQMSSTITPRTIDLAAQVVSDAGATTEFDKAWAIQEYLQSNYVYALNSEQTPKGQDAVDFFLFGKKVGRCEEFATSMVVMLRSQGIPARLVSGFRSGDETDSADDYVYRGTQAHTWVEVYFPKYGWIPFEPTPNEPGFDHDNPGPPAPVATAQTGPAAEPTATPTPETAAAAASPTALPPAAVIRNDDSGDWMDWLRSGLGLTMLVATGGVAATVLAMAAAWAWGLRGLSPGAALYARVQRIGRLWGVEPHPSMTPAEYASEFGLVVPKAGRAVQMVTALYAAERYGGQDISNEARSGGRQAWRAVRTAVFGWRPWKRRKRRER